MGYHPRIETNQFADLITTRTRNSQLWLINNPGLEKAILSYAAKYSNKYKVDLYSLAIHGNHLHCTAQFNNLNRSEFMRDFKSSVAKAVTRYCPSYPGGSLWGRRYSNEFLPGADDTENWFFYTVLQPIKDGLVEKISDYPGYNCFHDAVWGIKRTFKIMNWSAYHKAKRLNPRVKKINFLEKYTLQYQRLPGYENLSQNDYANLMMKKLEARRIEIVNKRYSEGKNFLGRAAILQTKPGSLPLQTKSSTKNSHRPRVLCVCPQRRSEALEWYFSIYRLYKQVSLAYRQGNSLAVFPPGTYKPYCKTCSLIV